MRRILLLGVLFSAVALVAACGGGDDEDNTSSGSGGAATSTAATGGGGAATTVKATLSEFKIDLDKTSAQAGKVTFDAQNKGAIAHELIAVKTDLAPDKLPVTSEGTVDMSKVQSAGDIAQFDAGKTADGTFTLAAGKYVIICNVPSHYQAGMHTAFTVQ
jgi:uncharacterized cupredoxin-like copper-binding protein